jgi:tricorn protease
LSFVIAVRWFRGNAIVSPPKNLENVYFTCWWLRFLELRGKALVCGNWEGSVQQIGWHKECDMCPKFADGKNCFSVYETWYERFEIHLYAWFLKGSEK